MLSVTNKPLSRSGNSKPRHALKWPGILKPREVVSSMDLLRRLEKRGYSPPAARKILERDFADFGVWRSDQLRLATGARLYASKLFYGDAPFLRAIRPILERQRSGVARVLDAIELFDALDLSAITRLTAVRLDPTGTGKALRRELAAIAEAGLGKLEINSAGWEYLVRTKHAGTPESEKLALQLMAQREAERQWLALLLKQLRRQNLIEWNTPVLYDRPFNRQLFSGYAFSKLRPLLRFKKRKAVSCPVVFEILNRNAEVFDVTAFMERMLRAGANPQAKLRMLGIIGAPSFSRDAFNLARQNGMMAVNFREMFGQAALDLMVAAEDLFVTFAPTRGSLPSATSAAEVAEKFAVSITALRNHPMVTDLSGMAFEAFACAALSGKGYAEVRAGLKVPFRHEGVATYREADVTGHSDDAHYIIECKALNGKNEVDREDVRKFLTETVPAYLHHVGKSNVDSCRAEIWTTGKVSEDTRSYLASLPLNKRVVRAIHTRDTIPVPRKLKPLTRILDVMATL